MGITNYAKNKTQDFIFRAQAWSIPASIYVGLIGGSNFPNQGAALRSKSYTVGQYAWPTAPNGRLYKVTTAGTTGANEPSWPVTDGGTVTDGTVVWTEQTLELNNGTIPEVSGNAYARQAITRSLAAIMGGNLAASASASSGTSGTIANLAQVQFPVANPNAWGPIWGGVIFDAATGGNPIFFDALGTPKLIGASDQLAFAGGTANTAYGAIQITLKG